MISEILNEFSFKKRLCDWLLKYERGFKACYYDYSLEDIAEIYKLPEIDYVHTQSQLNENGDLITLLKGKITISATVAKNHGEPLDFVFYRVLKTPTDTPEVEPFPVGYIIYQANMPKKKR